MIIFTSTACQHVVLVFYLLKEAKMVYNPLLQDLEKWQKKEHLYAKRYKWWHDWSRYANLELTQELLEQDEFETPTTITDFATGQPVHEISIFSFSENVGLQIEREFKELHIKIQDKCITLEKESQKKNFLTLINKQVENLLAGVQKLDLEDIYKHVLIREFKSGQESVSNLMPLEIRSSEAEWHFKYACTNIRERNQNLNLFASELVSCGLIEGREENIRNLKRFFKEGKVSDRVIWSASKSQLVTFFRELVKRNFVETRNHWIAVDNCFLILHNGEKYSTNGLKSEKGTQNKKKKEVILSLIDLLEN